MNVINTDIQTQEQKQNIQCCPICLGEVVEPKDCKVCKNVFCKLCVLQWKITSNKCPFKCSNDWNIDLNDINEYNSNGYLVCPLDKRIGSLNCRKCKKKLEFEKMAFAVDYKCQTCNNYLEYYLKTNKGHENCNQNKIFYYYCQNCDLKICDCIEKIK